MHPQRRVRTRKTQGPLNTEAKLVIPQTILTGIENSSQDGSTQKTHEQKIVEMPHLKRSVLAVVGETKQFPLILGNRIVGLVQPLEERSRREA